MKNIIEHLERLSLSYKNIKLYPLLDNEWFLNSDKAIVNDPELKEFIGKQNNDASYSLYKKYEYNKV